LDEIFTSQNLTLLYHLPVSVANIAGKRVALWA
jgi:ABC-type enterochelin transport system ATPase subunit